MAFGSWLLALGFWLLARIDLSSTIIFQYILSSLLLLTLLLFFMALAVGPAERGLLARIDLCSIFIFHYPLSSLLLLETHTSLITLAHSLAFFMAIGSPARTPKPLKGVCPFRLWLLLVLALARLNLIRTIIFQNYYRVRYSATHFGLKSLITS